MLMFMTNSVNSKLMFCLFLEPLPKLNYGTFNLAMDQFSLGPPLKDCGVVLGYG